MQRAARRSRLAEGGKYMLHTDYMLSDHRSAPRETPDQLESLCAKAVLGTSVPCRFVARFDAERLGATRVQEYGHTQCTAASVTICSHLYGCKPF